MVSATEVAVDAFQLFNLTLYSLDALGLGVTRGPNSNLTVELRDARPRVNLRSMGQCGWEKGVWGGVAAPKL